MPRVRTTDKAPAILDAALRRFLHYGLKKTTMQEIARDADVAVGTLYLYFEDKDALVIGCADRFAERHRTSVRELLAERRPVSGLSDGEPGGANRAAVSSKRHRLQSTAANTGSPLPLSSSI